MKDRKNQSGPKNICTLLLFYFNHWLWWFRYYAMFCTYKHTLKSFFLDENITILSHFEPFWAISRIMMDQNVAQSSKPNAQIYFLCLFGWQTWQNVQSICKQGINWTPFWAILSHFKANDVSKFSRIS